MIPEDHSKSIFKKLFAVGCCVVIIGLSCTFVSLISQRVFRKYHPETFKHFIYNADQNTHLSYYNYLPNGNETVFFEIKKKDALIGIIVVRSQIEDITDTLKRYDKYTPVKINDIEGFTLKKEEMSDRSIAFQDIFIFQKEGRTFVISYQDERHDFIIEDFLLMGYSLKSVVKNIVIIGN